VSHHQNVPSLRLLCCGWRHRPASGMCVPGPDGLSGNDARARVPLTHPLATLTLVLTPRAWRPANNDPTRPSNAVTLVHTHPCSFWSNYDRHQRSHRSSNILPTIFVGSGHDIVVTTSAKQAAPSFKSSPPLFNN